MKDFLLLLLAGWFIVLTVGICVRGAWVDEDGAVRALETQGYSNVRITEKDWFASGLSGCDENDAVRFAAVATNPVGNQVEVIVCAGWPFKGYTVHTK